jgi:predicted metalloprotease
VAELGVLLSGGTAAIAIGTAIGATIKASSERRKLVVDADEARSEGTMSRLERYTDRLERDLALQRQRAEAAEARVDELEQELVTMRDEFNAAMHLARAPRKGSS